MNKWIAFILSAILSLLSTRAVMAMLQHYYGTIAYENFEHWDNVAAIGIAEVALTYFSFLIHFVLHVVISLVLVYKIKSRKIPIHILVRFTDSWIMNIIRIVYIFMIAVVLFHLISYTYPAWSITVTILMLVVYSFWILQFFHSIVKKNGVQA